MNFAIHSSVRAILVAGALAGSSPALSQGAGCPREQVQDIADRYVKAQQTGSIFALPIGEWVDYRENMVMNSTATGVIGTPMDFAWTLKLLDTASCRVFVEGVILDPKPYVLASAVNNGFFGVGSLNTVVSQPGDWLFDASHTYEYARREDWSDIPEGQRQSRAELISVADKYLDKFSDKSIMVPWGEKCSRLEGGAYTGDTCDVGIPEGVEMADRDYIVDPVKGAVAVMLRMGGKDGLADAHTFRIENGKIRYVHTVTNCGGKENCGFEPFAEMLKKNPGMQPPYAD